MTKNPLMIEKGNSDGIEITDDRNKNNERKKDKLNGEGE
jgi:hypothetical protein